VTTEWRLVIDGPLDGALNMARDRSIQLARESGEAPPTLRLYRWRVPTITLGRFQDAAGVDLEACAARRVEVVRRSTGGRGVLHDDEITYSVVAGVADGVPRGVAASYVYLSRALAETYRTLGLDAQVTRRESGGRGSAACYLANTRADLSHGRAKLSGSAQVWHGSTVLQHGSFTRSRDVELEALLFRLDEGERETLAGHTATLETAMIEAPTLEAVTDAAVKAFESTLGITLRLMELSEAESACAAELAPGFVVQAASERFRSVHGESQSSTVQSE
jgi:lipoate-protein ligase A